jgi:hypothetical protein
MENKSGKYIWIAFCAVIVIFRFVFQIIGGGFDTGGLSVINTAYILIFITAIIHELNLNRAIFYVMLAVSLLTLVYGYFFTSLF